MISAAWQVRHCKVRERSSGAMAIPVAINTAALVDHFPFFEEVLFGRGVGRYQLHRASVYATIACNPSTFTDLCKAIRREPYREVQQAALNWQPDPEDDLDESEVFHILRQLEATSSESTFEVVSLANKPLIATAECPTYAARAQGLPSSSFHRYSIRTSTIRNFTADVAQGQYSRMNHSDMGAVACKCPRKLFRWLQEPLLWSSSGEKIECLVFWLLQLDFVDLRSRTPYPSWRPRKRRRTVDFFPQVPLGGREAVPGVNHAPENKIFRGIRYRDNRKRWIAEMKPPKISNKVSFGDFRSPTEAARVVDAAFYYYGKELNFEDTPRILSSRPVPRGLTVDDELKFVKEQAKWLASMASSLPPSTSSSSSTEPHSAPSHDRLEISQALTGSANRHTLTIMSPLRMEEADDGSSIAWNCPKSPPIAVTNVVNYSVEQPCDSFQESWMNFPVMSPPVIPWQVPSPGDSQDDVVGRLLQNQMYDELSSFSM